MRGLALILEQKVFDNECFASLKQTRQVWQLSDQVDQLSRFPSGHNELEAPLKKSLHVAQIVLQIQVDFFELSIVSLEFVEHVQVGMKAGVLELDALQHVGEKVGTDCLQRLQAQANFVQLCAGFNTAVHLRFSA